MKNLILITIIFSTPLLAKGLNIKALEKACNKGEAPSCQKIGDACEKNNAEACFVWGYNLLGEDDVRAQGLLKKACDLGHAKACQGYIKSKEITDNANQPREITEAPVAAPPIKSEAQRAADIRQTKGFLNFINSNPPKQQKTTHCTTNAYFGTVDCTED